MTIETFTACSPGRKIVLRKNLMMGHAPRDIYILVPGLGNDACLYDDLLLALDTRSLAAVALDLPGFGGSAHLPDSATYSLARNTQALCDVLEDLTFEAYHLVLHSMAVGLLLSELPTTPVTLTLIEGNVIPSDAEWASEISDLGDGEAYTQYVARLSRHGPRIVSMALRQPLAPERLAEVGKSYMNMDPRAFREIAAENLRCTQDGSYAEALEKLSKSGVPIRYLRGSDSEAWSGQPVLAEMGVTYQEVPGAGHYAMLDAPDGLADILAQTTVDDALDIR
jgi:pimeloyl-ACP methyl ester carboxylesterase